MHASCQCNNVHAVYSSELDADTPNYPSFWHANLTHIPTPLLNLCQVQATASHGNDVELKSVLGNPTRSAAQTCLLPSGGLSTLDCSCPWQCSARQQPTCQHVSPVAPASFLSHKAQTDGHAQDLVIQFDCQAWIPPDASTH